MKKKQISKQKIDHINPRKRTVHFDEVETVLHSEWLDVRTVRFGIKRQKFTFTIVHGGTMYAPLRNISERHVSKYKSIISILLLNEEKRYLHANNGHLCLPTHLFLIDMHIFPILTNIILFIFESKLKYFFNLF